MRDRTIRPETTIDRVRRLGAAVDQVVTAVNPDRKQALFHTAVNASIRVAHDQGDLAKWLDTADAWLVAHPAAADFTEREDRWLAELVAYEALSDALDDAKRRLL